jgi:hypothetical protein
MYYFFNYKMNEANNKGFSSFCKPELQNCNDLLTLAQPKIDIPYPTWEELNSNSLIEKSKIRLT